MNGLLRCQMNICFLTEEMEHPYDCLLLPVQMFPFKNMEQNGKKWQAIFLLFFKSIYKPNYREKISLHWIFELRNFHLAFLLTQWIIVKWGGSQDFFYHCLFVQCFPRISIVLFIPTPTTFYPSSLIPDRPQDLNAQSGFSCVYYREIGIKNIKVQFNSVFPPHFLIEGGRRS